MENAVTKTHLIPMLAKAGATQDVACAAQLGALGTWDFCSLMPAIGIVQTQVKVT
jgi:hypothetical protein